MPFCTNCGTSVSDGAAFCQNCGKPQMGGKAASPSDPFAGLSPRMASILCYTPWLGWIMCLVVLSVDRFRQDGVVRFHAFQGLYLGVAWLIVDVVIEPMLTVSGVRRYVMALLELGIVGVWIFMMVKTAANELIRLPVIGELADKSMNEQKTNYRN
jgi:uncharacterized membrane protein